MCSRVYNHIHELLSRECEVSVSHVLREPNACVDFLAKKGVVGMHNLDMLMEPLLAMGLLLRVDCVGTVFFLGGFFNHSAIAVILFFIFSHFR